ncbi:HNH endonuclease [Paenibacillus oryzisoli]|uniref:HNH endonuclease n=1 Tax=Paenibacillus oryzisoli TaxID=1850517 RepID=UPI003D2980EF
MEIDGKVRSGEEDEHGAHQGRHQEISGAGERGTSLDALPNADKAVAREKLCAYCGLSQPLAAFKRRTGKRRGATSRRGACRDCREKRLEPAVIVDGVDETFLASSAELDEGNAAAAGNAEEVKGKKKRRRRRKKKAKGAVIPVTAAPHAMPVAVQEKKTPEKKPVPIRELKAVGLLPNRNGFIRMRGKTDNGRKWHQEVDPELALTLVKERAAVVVNRYTIRRLYSNKEFRQLILERDNYTCRFCGQYGDTIDHMLPRAKGGHTTPDNCVCACMLCNQSKADRDMEEFMKETPPHLLQIDTQEP